MEEMKEISIEKTISDKIKFLGLKSQRFSFTKIGSSAKSKLEKAKLKHRSDLNLDEWDKLKYFKNDWCDKMIDKPPQGIQIINVEESDNLNREEFREKYEKLNKPVIIKGCSSKWPGFYKWNFDVLFF